MTSNFKRLSLALIALGISAPVLANTGSPFDVTVPNQQGGLTFGADALLLRPTASNLGYSNEFGPSYTIGLSTNTAGSSSDVDTSYQWGFDAMLGYRIPGTGNDVTLSWTHLGDFDNSDSNSTPFTTTADIGSTSHILDQSSSVEFNYDAVDLDLGQRVNFGDYFNFRMFAGVRWADLREDINNSYVDTATIHLIDTDATIIDTDSTYETNNSEFKGAGPQIGFDGRYCLGYGFGIDGNVTASLLVGDVDSSTSITETTSIDDTLTDITSSSLGNNNVDHVVPALDASLGLDYTYAFANCDRSYLTVEAGYRVINYFDVTQNILSDVTASTVSAPDTYTLGNRTGSVAFNGAYGGIKVNL